MKALILYHKTKEDLGSIKDVLLAREFDLDYYYGQDDIVKNIDFDAHDLAVIMGGSMGVYESDEHPYLLNEVIYIKGRIERNLPTLGICLGGQLMAKALGANVYKGQNGKETGWCEVGMTEEGLISPVKHLDKAYTRVTQAHQDTFDFPSGAVLLASSVQYKNQVFSYGDKALGFQCHPEADEQIIKTWTVKHDEFFFTKGMTKEVVEEETQKYLPTLKTQTAKFMNEWLDQVLGNNNA